MNRPNDDMDEIVEKIQKLLAMARRGGTEAEMNAFMLKVQELLAKHNLSLDRVEASATTEDYLLLRIRTAGPKQTWRKVVLGAIAPLYFCRALNVRSKTEPKPYVTVLGKKANIVVVSDIFNYVVRFCENKAKAHKPGIDRASFRDGFACRIEERCIEMVHAAIKGGIKDSGTGKDLIVAPLYNQIDKDMEEFLKNSKPAKHEPPNLGNPFAFMAGVAQADKVNLQANSLAAPEETTKIGRRA